jgi:hypothetical protein
LSLDRPLIFPPLEDLRNQHRQLRHGGPWPNTLYAPRAGDPGICGVIVLGRKVRVLDGSTHSTIPFSTSGPVSKSSAWRSTRTGGEFKVCLQRQLRNYAIPRRIRMAGLAMVGPSCVCVFRNDRDAVLPAVWAVQLILGLPKPRPFGKMRDEFVSYEHIWISEANVPITWVDVGS